MPKPAAAHVRDLPMCVLMALTRIVGNLKALVRHIWLSASSGGSKQVQLSGPHFKMQPRVDLNMAAGKVKGAKGGAH